MPLSVPFNGNVYTIPLPGDNYGWGAGTTAYLNALSVAFAPNTSTFILGAEVNMGTAFGLRLPYIRSSSANPAAAGSLRLSNFDTVNWRNAANSADLTLGVNGSNQLVFNGSALGTGTVTSVTFALTGVAGPLTLIGSPITTSGTYTLSSNQFDSTTPGHVPASGGGTSNFLRADGSWVAPSGAGTVTSVAISGANGISVVSGSPITSSGTIALSFVAPGTSGNILTSNGTSWTSAAPSGGAATWGLITGTLSAQTDLQAALDAKADDVAAAILTSVTVTPSSGTGSITTNVGGSAATNTLTLVHADGATVAESGFLSSLSSSTGAAQSVISMRRSRGTAASPTAVTTNDLLGSISFSGYDGSAYAGGSSISSFANENWSGSARGTTLTISVRPTGSTTSTAVTRFSHNGTRTLLALPVAGGTDIVASGNLSITDGSGTAIVQVNPTAQRVTALTNFRPPLYTLATLPGAPGIGDIIYVSDANSGVGTIAFYNGAWIDVKTGVVVV